ncbi:unnamed protein product [Prorocentrum cordatum]|uniref:Uncharacterized protein n=1 Tax=Prorocentrum cordatum TaxID=2364126 RepID=A0ABN9PQR3_9DINO|nr:unnamed protein product [Polarella glacialis]
MQVPLRLADPMMHFGLVIRLSSSKSWRQQPVLSGLERVLRERFVQPRGGSEWHVADELSRNTTTDSVVLPRPPGLEHLGPRPGRPPPARQIAARTGDGQAWAGTACGAASPVHAVVRAGGRAAAADAVWADGCCSAGQGGGRVLAASGVRASLNSRPRSTQAKPSVDLCELAEAEGSEPRGSGGSSDARTSDRQRPGRSRARKMEKRAKLDPRRGVKRQGPLIVTEGREAPTKVSAFDDSLLCGAPYLYFVPQRGVPGAPSSSSWPAALEARRTRAC